MSRRPLAYHITFGTYGTRLHGDPRGTVHRSRNRFGESIEGQFDQWVREEETRLKFAPVRLTQPQRAVAEAVLPTVANRGGWTLHAAAAAVDHVHVLLTTSADGLAVRRWL